MFTYLTEYEAFLDATKAYEAGRSLIPVQAGCTMAVGNTFIGVCWKLSVLVVRFGWFP